MRDHPIPPVTEIFQYRAIGLVRGVYIPLEVGKLTRGKIIDNHGIEIDSVVLGRILSLMKHKLSLEKSHLWVVYPRCREDKKLHLQIAGIWEPSTLIIHENQIKDKDLICSSDSLIEGDDYFSIRGELIYSRSNTKDLIIKIRQKRKSNRKKLVPFKLHLKGEIPLKFLKKFVSLEVRRQGQELILENYEIVGDLSDSQIINKEESINMDSRNHPLKN